MDDLFIVKEEEQQPVFMDKDEYFERSQKLFNIISSEYSKSWQDRAIQDDEYPDETVCNDCRGCGIFQEDIGQCYQHHESGDCLVRYFDAEQFGAEIESKIEEVHSLIIDGLLLTGSD